jgi:hypothetical protein
VLQTLDREGVSLEESPCAVHLYANKRHVFLRMVLSPYAEPERRTREWNATGRFVRTTSVRIRTAKLDRRGQTRHRR